MPVNALEGEEKNDAEVTTIERFPSFDADMRKILISLLNVTSEITSKLCLALKEGGLCEWKSFLDALIEPDFARELTYMERGLATHIPRSIQRSIEALADFAIELQEEGVDLGEDEKDWKDVKSYTYKEFQAFRGERAQRLRNESVLNPPPPPAGSNKKSPQQVKYESWCRKARDEKSFTPLTNDSRFEHWLVGFKAKLEAYGIDTETFLDETWPPATLVGYTRDLYVKQCAFFWVLMLEVFKSDLSASCVHSHSTTRDGRKAYFDFVNLHSQSKAKESKVKFITHWFDELNHLNKRRPPNKPLEYHTVKSALCQACYSSFQLSEQFAKPDQQPASTLKDGGLPERRDQITEPRWWLHRVSRSSKQAREKRLDDSAERIAQPDQLPASTLKDTNTRAVSLKEETKESNQGGGSTGFRDPAKQAREKTLDDSAERIAQNNVSQKIEPEVFCGETDWKEQIAKSICPEGTDCKKHLPARKRKSKDMRTPNLEDRKDPKKEKRTPNSQEAIFHHRNTA
eukprot:jgi/Psemu1/46852/gm1.46852_g